MHHLWLNLRDTEEDDEDASDEDAKETTKKSTSNTAALRWQLLRKRAAELKKKNKSRQHKSPVDWPAFYRSHSSLIPSKAFIHQDENGGTIDPYFVPIISVKTWVASPDSQSLCANETVWKQYYLLSGASERNAKQANNT